MQPLLSWLDEAACIQGSVSHGNDRTGCSREPINHIGVRAVWFQILLDELGCRALRSMWAERFAAPDLGYDVLRQVMHMAFEGGLMKRVARSHVHVDRVACPWLIFRFVDGDAESLFVPASEAVTDE